MGWVELEIKELGLEITLALKREMGNTHANEWKVVENDDKVILIVH